MLFTTLLLGCAAASARQADNAQTIPHLYLLNADQLNKTRAQVQAGDPSLVPAQKALIDLADAAMDLPMLSVTDKPSVPPSGSKNDYVSLSPYWWPNPDTEDGLPYIRRDGEVNPERDRYDVNKLRDFGKAVSWLGFAYYFTDEERYAEEAVKRIKHFLLDPETRMTPRMKYGQFIPGVNQGRKFGIIETLRLRWVPDSIALLSRSPAMTPEVLAGSKQWFRDYADWLRTSEFGLAARKKANNHGTWCAAQIAHYSAFADDWETVRQVCESMLNHIDGHIDSDGKQPEELTRTKSLDYSEFNVRGMSDLAMLGERVGLDLWSYQSEDGSSIRKAIDFIAPHMTDTHSWPYKQISAPQEKHDWYVQTLRRASIVYRDPTYERTIDRLDGISNVGIVFRDLLMARPTD